MKCKCCGEEMGSYTAYCPACGKEVIREEKGSAIDELIKKLAEIDEEKKKYFLELEANKNKAADADEDFEFDDCSKEIERTLEEQKISLIRAFPIPTTFEGIYELMLLAASSFDARYYAERLNKSDVSDAWLAIMEQAYRSADIMFGDHPDFRKIQRLYDKLKMEKDEAIAQRKKAKRKTIILIGSCIALVAIIASVILPLSLRGKKIGKPADAFIGEPFQGVVFYLEDIGFNNITLVGTAERFEGFDSGDVVDIKINGVSGFGGEDRFKKKDAIEITYIRRYISVSVDAKDLKGKNYEDVVSLLKNMGFTNIQVVEQKDVTLGWIHNVGDVKSVSIDGDGKFNSGDEFWSDVVIVVTYHGQK